MTKNIIKYIFIFILSWALFQSSVLATNSDDLERKRQTVKKNIATLKLLEHIETNKLYKNQQKLEMTEQKLNENKEKYGETQEELSDLKSKLDELMTNYNEQISFANRRIVQIYKKQRKSYIEFLLAAKDLNSLLDRLYFENIIMRVDKERIRSTQIRTRRIMNLKDRIERQEKYLASNIKMMDKQQKNIQSAINKNERYIEKLKTDRATWEKAENELLKQSEQLTKLINKSTKYDSGKIVVTGGFLRPVQGRVSSEYGWRTHPIFNKRKFHSGVDLAAPMGTQVRVANSGKVIYTGWYGGYGKVVIVDHGKIAGQPTTTLYAHLSSYNVSQGQGVTKGQVIARVGTTGYSTGPHLHFEVRINGKTTNPFNYIPR